MRGESFRGSIDPVPEAGRDPEVEELLEFLDIYRKIQELLAWLIEASANSDTVIVGIRRARLSDLMQQLGLDPENPQRLTELEEINNELFNRIRRPQPRVDMPEEDFFASRIKEIVAERAPQHLEYVSDINVNLVQFAEHGHTDWGTIASRTGAISLAAYTRGLAQIMADPIAYHAEFGGLGIDQSRRAPDHLAVNLEWVIANGRHRALAIRSLGPEYVAESDMSQWVPVIIEEM